MSNDWSVILLRSSSGSRRSWYKRAVTLNCSVFFSSSVNIRLWACTRYCRSVTELTAGTGCGGRWSAECCSKGFCWRCRTDCVRKSIPVGNCSWKGVLVGISARRKWDECISSTLSGVSRGLPRWSVGIEAEPWTALILLELALLLALRVAGNWPLANILVP